MKIDRLILKELAGPWLFGVGLFTALIMAATYLGRLVGFIASGIPAMLVGELTALYMPAILVKTFSMAVLLAGLLGFGRLSSDSEIVALRAAGASITRIVFPVLAFSAVVSAMTFVFDEAIMPAASVKAAELTLDAQHRIHPNGAQPYATTIVQDQKLKASVTAKNINPATQELSGVSVLAYNNAGEVSYLMFADRVRFTGLVPDPSNWKAEGHVTLVPADVWSDTPGVTSKIIRLDNGAWPAEIPKPVQNFQQFASAGEEDQDALSMAQLKSAISTHEAQGDRTAFQIRNMQYWYWNKLAVPLAAIAFGALGAVLGIRSHRTGTATGMALAIAIIFGFVTLANLMNIAAESGFIPPWSASFTPLAISAVACGVIMWRRNS